MALHRLNAAAARAAPQGRLGRASRRCERAQRRAETEEDGSRSTDAVPATACSSGSISVPESATSPDAEASPRDVIAWSTAPRVAAACAPPHVHRRSFFKRLRQEGGQEGGGGGSDDGSRARDAFVSDRDRAGEARPARPEGRSASDPTLASGLGKCRRFEPSSRPRKEKQVTGRFRRVGVGGS